MLADRHYFLWYNFSMNRKGFTLVEVVVVMAIIAVLTVLIIGAINVARKQMKYAEARAEIRDIRTGIEAYLSKFGEYPAIGDSCVTCYIKTGDINTANTEWRKAIDAMRDAGVFDQKNADRYYTDPWGMPYAYDDNYGQCNLDGSVFSEDSTLCTAGPDQKMGDNGNGDYTWGEGDDDCNNINHGSSRPCFFYSNF